MAATAEAAAAATSAAVASAVLAAFEASTTDWRAWDGAVTDAHMFTVVFWPVALALWLLVPAALCYFCLSRGRITPYVPSNYQGGGYQGNEAFGKVAHLFSFPTPPPPNPTT